MSAPAPVQRELTSEIRDKLDATERLAPGRGKLDLGAYVRGTRETGVGAGGFLDYQHRISPSTALFGQGQVGWHSMTGLGYEATAGLRMRF